MAILPMRYLPDPILRSKTVTVPVRSLTNALIQRLVNEMIESWDFNRPGVDVLEWAYSYLAENNFIDPKAV